MTGADTMINVKFLAENEKRIVSVFKYCSLNGDSIVVV